MEFELWYLVAVPILFAAGWWLRGVDSKQRKQPVEGMDEYYTKANNTITVHIRRLREKLNDTLENPKYIRTIWGVGYRIDEK